MIREIPEPTLVLSLMKESGWPRFYTHVAHWG